MTLKEHRLQLGLTQSELERLSGISVKTIQQIENHKRPLGGVSVNTAIRLANALGITVEELVGKVFEMDDEIYFENDFVWFKQKEARE